MESVEEYIDRVIKDEKRWKKERTLEDLIKGTRTYKGTKRAFIVETKYEDSPDKIIVLDELEFLDTGEKRLRFGYYIRGENGKFVFGQFALMLSREDLQRLLEEAKLQSFKI